MRRSAVRGNAARTHVFVSFVSATDDAAGKTASELVVDGLERRGIGCWVSWRDISPGQRYPQAISEAIDDARALVVLLSPGSLQSEHVLTELELAVHAGVEIFPLKLAPIAPSGEVRYYLNRRQWIDASERPLGECMDELRDALVQLGDLAPPDTSRRSVSVGGVSRWVRRHPILTGCLSASLVLGVFVAWIVYQLVTSVSAVRDGSMPPGLPGDLMRQQMRAHYGDQLGALRVETSVERANVLVIGPEESVERGPSPFEPRFALVGHYTILAHAPGQRVARREFDLPVGEDVSVVRIDLEPAGAPPEPLPIDLFELTGRQIQFLERDLIIEASVAAAARFRGEWESRRHDYYALTLMAPEELEDHALWRAGGRVGTLYLRNDERGAALYRTLPRNEFEARAGRLTIRIHFDKYDPDDNDQINAELVDWSFD